MSLTNQLNNLNAAQLKSLSNTMLSAGIAHENDKNPREIFRRAKYRHVGLMHRIYELLQHASHDEIEAMTKSLADIQ